VVGDLVLFINENDSLKRGVPKRNNLLLLRGDSSISVLIISSFNNSRGEFIFFNE
jgi:hypothetical protein